MRFPAIFLLSGALASGIVPQLPSSATFVVEANTRPAPPPPSGAAFTVSSGACELSHGGLCVQSPNYPAVYGSNERCTIIARVGMSVVMSHFIPAESDILTINDKVYQGRDGPGTLTLSRANITWESCNLSPFDSRPVGAGWQLCEAGSITNPPPTPPADIEYASGEGESPPPPAHPGGYCPPTNLTLGSGGFCAQLNARCHELCPLAWPTDPSTPPPISNQFQYRLCVLGRRTACGLLSPPPAACCHL